MIHLRQDAWPLICFYIHSHFMAGPVEFQTMTLMMMMLWHLMNVQARWYGLLQQDWQEK